MSGKFERLEKIENNYLLNSLRKRVKSLSNCLALCLVRGGVHGYLIEFELAQTAEGCFIIRYEDDFGRTNPNQKLRLNLLVEFENLKKEQPILRTTLPHDEEGGRYATIFIATTTEGEWITCQRPLTGKPFKDTATNRIYNALTEDQN